MRNGDLMWLRDKVVLGKVVRGKVSMVGALEDGKMFCLFTYFDETGKKIEVNAYAEDLSYDNP